MLPMDLRRFPVTRVTWDSISSPQLTYAPSTRDIGFVGRTDNCYQARRVFTIRVVRLLNRPLVSGTKEGKSGSDFEYGPA